MAEGLVNQLFSDRLEAKSGGTKPSALNPLAVQVMKEIGVDISRQRSKHLDELEGEHFDMVVTMCTEDETNCPFFPGKEHMHHGFRDPSRVAGTDEERLQAVREIRDDIRGWIEANFMR
jgi:arsenate reductase